MSDLHEPPLDGQGAPTPARARCHRYGPGHTPDLVRVRLAQMSRPEEWWQAVVLGTRDDVVTLAVDDELADYRSHDAGLLSALVAEHGARAMLNAEHSLLFLAPRADGASPVFSLQPAAEPANPCSIEPTAG